MKAVKLILMTLMVLAGSFATAGPIEGMLERIDKGASKKFITELRKSDTDFFELDQRGSKVVVRGNTYINIACGINWYLKYHAGIHLSWNGMTAKLPAVLPPVTKKERRETDLSLRYDFNYCTFSYSMAFWDWARWEKEIDWMALHGVNLPLAAVGEECVWRNMLLKLGYTSEEINRFIAGPAFLAWWEMNNLEGWGGPNPDSWYAQQEVLQKKILKRMKEYGIEPVFPGYSGMVPSNAKEKLGLNVTDPEIWNGYLRPAFLQPTDARYQEIAALYYQEREALFGKANYYSMDPFHESKAGDETDFNGAGQAVLKAMKKANPHAVWVIQGWTENPRQAMIQNIPTGDLLILDLFSECRPMWGIPSIWKREKGYEQHEWLFCLLQNFGGNVGLHGRMDQLLNNFYLTKNNPLAARLKGIGFSMEGSENNPVMFELMSELPWRPEKFTKETWIKEYLTARYGQYDENIAEAWDILIHGIYNCPAGNNQQGPHESIFCGRPSMDNFQASSWSKMQNYYDPHSTAEAARCMAKAADRFRGNNNYEYDLVDITRQAVADRGRMVYNYTIADFKNFDRQAFDRHSRQFLDLLLMQDELLGSRSEFRVGRWTSEARQLGNTPEEKDLYEWNARVQITTWGNRTCADRGLRDYAHKEWNGLLKDFYYQRWSTWWNLLQKELEDMSHEQPIHPGLASTMDELSAKRKQPVTVDWYAIEEPWTIDHTPYSAAPEGDCIDLARKALHLIETTRK